MNQSNLAKDLRPAMNRSSSFVRLFQSWGNHQISRRNNVTLNHLCRIPMTHRRLCNVIAMFFLAFWDPLWEHVFLLSPFSFCSIHFSTFVSMPSHHVILIWVLLWWRLLRLEHPQLVEYVLWVGACVPQFRLADTVAGLGACVLERLPVPTGALLFLAYLHKKTRRFTLVNSIKRCVLMWREKKQNLLC